MNESLLLFPLRSYVVSVLYVAAAGPEEDPVDYRGESLLIYICNFHVLSHLPYENSTGIRVGGSSRLPRHQLRFAAAQLSMNHWGVRSLLVLLWLSRVN